MARPRKGLGDGRDRLLRACWELLVDAAGSDHAVTVAAVCRRARCTPPTLYHHFADLPTLRRAAGQRAFSQWAEQVEKRIADTADPADRLRQRGAAYLAWGVEHPQAYRALFLASRSGAGDAAAPDAPDSNAQDPGAPDPDAPDPDAPVPVAPNLDAPNPDAPNPDAPNPDAPGAGFHELITDLAALRGASANDPALLPLALAYWSAVHGLTSLAVVNGDLPRQLRETTYQRLAEALIASARRTCREMSAPT